MHIHCRQGLYDVKEIYNTVKDVYSGECAIPLNKRNSKNPEKFPSGHPICEARLAMHKDGKFSDRGRTRQKYCCPLKSSKCAECPCDHKNWNNGKKNRGCTKYITVPDDHRLSIDRECISFKKIYALRTEPSVIIPALKAPDKNVSKFAVLMPRGI